MEFLENNLKKSNDENENLYAEVSSNEIFSFNIWILINLIFGKFWYKIVIYLLIILLPQEILNNLSIDNYVNKYWLIAIPIHFLVTLVFIYLSLSLIFYFRYYEIDPKFGKFI